VTPEDPWVCPNCKIEAATPFCATCGERRLQPRDLSLHDLFDHIFKSLSSVDARLIRSLRMLVNRPGALTVAYLEGQRKPYIGPFSLFVLANLLFFAAQSVSETKVFSTGLESHLQHQDWSGLAQQLVDGRLAAKQTTLEIYAPLFNAAVALNAKSLIILMVLPFALLATLLFYRSRLPMAAHAVFSLHLYAFLLLLFCVALAASAIHVLAGGAGLASSQIDHILSLVNLAACASYLYVAIGRVYGARGAARVAKVAVLTLAAACIVVGYRFTLLLITLYTT
jgi:hypothetical protein